MPALNAGSKSSTNIESEASREIVASRLFDAPRDLVFRMWTDPKHVAQWWGPIGFTTTIETMDVRPGGVWKFVLHGPDGTDYRNKIVFVEVVAPERLVYDHVSGPLFHATATFAAEGKKTRVTVRMLFETKALRDKTVEDFGAVEGLNQTLGRLAEHLAGGAQEPFVISHTFDAPRDLVFRLWTDDEHLKRWFGPKGSKITYSKNDLRPGGTFHFRMRIAEGMDLWGKWTYREIVPPERLVFINSFSDENGGLSHHPFAPEWPAQMLSTITFAEDRGKTTVTVSWYPINATDIEHKTFNAGRDSMHEGWTGTFEQLEAHVGTVNAKP